MKKTLFIILGMLLSTQLGYSQETAKVYFMRTTGFQGSAQGFTAFIDGELVDWQSVVTSNTTMVAGRGYIVNTTGGAISMTLPSSATIGDTIAIKDYAGTFATNNLTILRNSHKIQGNTNDSIIETNRASVTLVYADATKGWLFTDEHNVADLEQNPYVTATGGTVSNTGDYRVHTFNSSSNFVISDAGTGSPTSGKVDYMVIAGGGGGGSDAGGGGGAGGYRESAGTDTGSYTVSPLGSGVPSITVTSVTEKDGGTTSPIPISVPVSTTAEEIVSDKFSHLSVAPIPGKVSSTDPKIELKVEPFPVAFPAPPGPAAAAPNESNNVSKFEISARFSPVSIPVSTGFDDSSANLSKISLPLNALLSKIESKSLSSTFLLIITAVGFFVVSLFSFKKGTIPFNSTVTVFPFTLKIKDIDSWLSLKFNI